MKYFLPLLTLSAVSALNDSPFPFRLFGFEEQYHTCDDIGTDGLTCDSGNDFEGYVKTHCPTTCDATGVYESTMYVDFGIVKDGVVKPKQCRPWISQVEWSKCTQRCAGGLDGNKVGIPDTCENSCYTCALIAMDSTLPFKFGKKYYTCNDVADGKDGLSCTSGNNKVGYVKKHCSDTCKGEEGSFDESDMYVDVGIVKKGKTKAKKCHPWIKQKKWSKCVQRCNKPEVRQSCPKSCWECDGRQAI